MTPEDFVSKTQGSLAGQQKLVIDGKPWAESISKVGMLVPCVLLGVWLWRYEDPYFTGANAVFQLKGVAVIVFLIAVCLPANAHTYLDLCLRRLVTQTHYAGLKVYERYHPFDDYDSIVVRHRCYSTEA